MGRPTKLLQDAVREKLLTAIRAGNYIETAVRYADIGESTFYLWREKAGKGRQPYAAFMEAVEKARADAEVRMVAIVATAAQGSGNYTGTWQAAAWWLERSFPDRWGHKQRVDIGAASSLRIVLEEGNGKP